MIGSVLSHEIQRHIVSKELNSQKGESILQEAQNTVEGFFSSVELWMLIVGVVLIAIGLVAYSVAGKGQGSHAGREEIRRSYRRELAKQMARQDAEQIKLGNKPRKRWMQW